MEDGATFSIASIFSRLRAPQPARKRWLAGLAHQGQRWNCAPSMERRLCVHGRAAHWVLGPNRVLRQPEGVGNPEEIHAKLISLHPSFKNRYVVAVGLECGKICLYSWKKDRSSSRNKRLDPLCRNKSKVFLSCFCFHQIR